MLIRFTVENFLSFNKRCDFSMIASPEERHPHHVIREDNNESIGVLRTSIIYGANAAGKSNLIKAMSFAQDMIVEGVDKNKNILIKNFKLDKSCYNKPSRFEFEFKHNNKQYAYGFSLDESKIHDEWLYEIGLTLEKPIFERENNEIKFNFHHSLLSHITDEERNRLNYEAESTRKNLLFLTNCKERNIEYFEGIYNWFDDVLKILFPHSQPFYISLLISTKSKLFTDILKSFDFDIKHIDFNESKLEDSEEIPKEIREKIKEVFPFVNNIEDKKRHGIFLPSLNLIITQDEKSNDLNLLTLRTIRYDSDEQAISFDIAEESDGTQRIIDLIPMLIQLKRGSSVFVIDEIERSLHSLLIKSIFEFFLSSKDMSESIYNSDSQLIATTHNVYLLDIKNLFRQDEIWFIEKDKTGQSIAYSLANTDVNGLDLVKGYFNGRFGAIPFIRDLKELGWNLSEGEENV